MYNFMFDLNFTDAPLPETRGPVSQSVSELRVLMENDGASRSRSTPRT